MIYRSNVICYVTTFHLFIGFFFFLFFIYHFFSSPSRKPAGGIITATHAVRVWPSVPRWIGYSSVSFYYFRLRTQGRLFFYYLFVFFVFLRKQSQFNILLPNINLSPLFESSVFLTRKEENKNLDRFQEIPNLSRILFCLLFFCVLFCFQRLFFLFFILERGLAGEPVK